jgi:hypothetical protein
MNQNEVVFSNLATYPVVMANHVPNRRGLDDAEISELDDIMVEYNAAREQARNAIIAAQAAYQATIGHASERRDDQILGIIDAAGGRGTQSRVVEHLGMNPSYLAIRLRKARERATNDESVTPRAKAPSG